ncbi:MAG: sugar ABC transporter permease [Clostridia bacterium]|nr:sugar ABC transporter permease [Clostridia bacterium]
MKKHKDGRSEKSVLIKKDIQRNYSLYLLVIPVLLWYAYFCYKPMYGILMAFQNFNFRRGIWGSEWVGMENFIRFFSDPYFVRNIVNTINISFTDIIFGFPMPILFALLINEIPSKKFAKVTQTITYMPHFVSLVVICGMIKSFVGADGIITNIVSSISGKTIEESLLNNASLYVPIHVLSGIWQELGWNSIIYLAALSGVDESLYEAAEIDGANRFKQIIHITIPSIVPVIITMLILRLGSVLSVGYEKVMLLTNSFNAVRSEILSYYTYKVGILGGEYSLSTAAGLFNSVINCVFIFAANAISRKVSETSLW